MKYYQWRIFLETRPEGDITKKAQSLGRRLEVGSVLVDRYLIQDVIGVGGMGAVYRARDLHFSNVVKVVAVKEMIIEARDPLIRSTIVENFEREANILVTLSHPSIPKIFDYFSHEERSYLVLEFIQGKDLESLLGDSPSFFTEESVIAWAIELCDVLEYLHNHKPEPIVFRDMKPSNVMVNQNNHIVLIDFGIAKLFKEGQKGTMIGTEGYSPPEQYRGEASPQADIYSLGATLHHLMSKVDPRMEPPFTFGERPIRKKNPTISVEFETVINTALQYNPSDRFKTAGAMKEALLMAAQKTGVLGRIAPKTSGAPKEQMVRPIWSFVCEDEIRGAAAASGGYVYIGSYDNNLYAVDAASGKFVWKYATRGGIVGRPAIHEGFVFIGSEDGNLYTISAKTGALSWSYAASSPIHSSPRTAEGHVFFGTDDGLLHAVNLNTNRCTWRVEANAAIHSTPFIHNEGIFFGSENGEVLHVDFSGQIKWRFKAKRAVTSSPFVANGRIYFASLDSTFYALESKGGWALWRYRMGKGSVSSPCMAENLLFFGSADGYIYCVDASSAKEVWKYQTENQVSGSPLVYKDSVYCGSADGTIYCLEYRSGRLRWKFATGGRVTAAPIVYNDTLYLGSSDRHLYAFST